MKMRSIKRISIALALALAMTSFSFAATIPSDVQRSGDENLKVAVESLMEKGAITGDSDGLFHPNQNLTRAQVCKMIVTLTDPIALNGTVTVEYGQFDDMKGYDWAGKYISYAANKGIAKGYGGNVFRPGNNVTLAELTTFVVRACGYTDSDLGGDWPQNYIVKATELGLFDNLDIVAGKDVVEAVTISSNQKATKADAAIIIYNGRDLIKADVVEKEPQGLKKDKTSEMPVQEEMVFVNGKFSTNMDAYDGKNISADAVVYAYGLKKEYNSSMVLPTEAKEYRLTTVLKYKAATTPAWYKLENGVITEMVLPGDAGFTGKIYCVVNDIKSTVNFEDDIVNSLDTLTAMSEISWMCKKGLVAGSAISNIKNPDGQVYELTAKNGEVSSIASTTAGKINGKYFIELTSGNKWYEIVEKDGELVKIKDSDGNSTTWIGIKDNAAIYKIDNKEYEQGRTSQIKKGNLVRLYDVSDDDEPYADIVVIKENK